MLYNLPSSCTREYLGILLRTACLPSHDLITVLMILLPFFCASVTHPVSSSLLNDVLSRLSILLFSKQSILYFLPEQISRLDCKDVLEITCNLETEGEENTAFILCTTFLTQQLQQQNLYCSWCVVTVGNRGVGYMDGYSQTQYV